MKKALIVTAAIVSSVVLLSPGVRAQSPSTLAGTWNGITFSVPSQVTAEINTNGAVTRVPQAHAFGAESFQVTVLPDGTFTTPEGGGSVSINGQGSFTVHPSGSPSISFRANSAQDVFAGLVRADSGNDARNELNLLVRAPSSLAAADVAGAWTMIMFSTPQQLVEVLTTNGTLQDLNGMDNQSLSSSAFSLVESGSMTIYADGTLSGVAEGNFTGTYTLAGAGQIDVSIDTGEGILPMTCLINASRNTMITLLNHDPDNRQELVLLTKKPGSVTLADLRGVWNATSFNVPANLTLWKNTNNIVVNLSSGGGFDMNQDAQFTAGHTGFLTGIMEGQMTIGAISASNDGTTTVIFTNRLGQVDSHTGHLNAAKDCIFFPDISGDTRGITVVSKAPDWPGTAQNFGLQLFNGAVVWASDTNILLQSSGTLNGGWTNVPNTLGQHRFQPPSTNGAAFYRVGGQ